MFDCRPELFLFRHFVPKPSRPIDTPFMSAQNHLGPDLKKGNHRTHQLLATSAPRHLGPTYQFCPILYLKEREKERERLCVLTMNLSNMNILWIWIYCEYEFTSIFGLLFRLSLLENLFSCTLYYSKEYIMVRIFCTE